MKNAENCIFKGIVYERSDTIEKQGKRSSIEKYLKNGYYIKDERNGYWVLVKPSRVIVTVKSSVSTQNINLKQEILDFYCKSRISEKQIENFVKDIENGKVSICLDASSNYYIKSVRAS